MTYHSAEIIKEKILEVIQECTERGQFNSNFFHDKYHNIVETIEFVIKEESED